MNSDFQLNNLVQRVWTTAQKNPDRVALIFAETGEQFTFSEVLQNSNHVRLRLREKGFQKGDRVLVVIPPRKDLFFTLLALFAEGIVPVLIDPRLPISQWKRAFQQAQPKATILPRSFRWALAPIPQFWKHQFVTTESLAGTSAEWLDPIPLQPHSESLITMTSGTTGAAKLIVRNHSVLAAQQNLACKLLPPLELDQHLAGYPVSILQSLVEGATTYAVSPRKLEHTVCLLKGGQVTRLSGPPGFISQIIEALDRPIPHVRSVLLGGAPLQDWLLKKIYETFPQSQVHVIYGATEAEPISYIEAGHCLNEKRPGYLVGVSLPEIQMDAKPFPLAHDPEAFEVVIQGPHIVGHEPHSTGDIAIYSKDRGLILLGRKSEAIQADDQVFMPGFLESYLEKEFQQIRRVAVLAHEQKLFVFVELFPQDQHIDKEQLKKEAKARLQVYWKREIAIELVPQIPVDRRHLWKANKIALKKQFL